MYTPQMNIVFHKGIADSPVVPTDLGTVVRYNEYEPANEWDDVAAFATSGSINVFFVWDFEQDMEPYDAEAAAQQGTRQILFGDPCANPDRNMAHEVGHVLGLEPSDYMDAARLGELMYGRTDGGCQILHSQMCR